MTDLTLYISVFLLSKTSEMFIFCKMQIKDSGR